MPLPQLIKYIGNKTKVSENISFFLSKNFDTYVEPFFGSGALLGELQPKKSIAVDIHQPLIDMWKLAQKNPNKLSEFYEEKWMKYSVDDKSKKSIYNDVVKSYNDKPNPLDFLFISRTCYGGVLRYRKKDGGLSTPVGPHLAINPNSFNKRLKIWGSVIKNTRFICGDYKIITDLVSSKTLIYCDPPYIDTQKILYGAQEFKFAELQEEISKWKMKKSQIALSIDGSKFSGSKEIETSINKKALPYSFNINLGGSMLKRFQLKDKNTKKHIVSDKLYLSFKPDNKKPTQLSI